ncbi:uncharacterized protein DDB_G0283697-like isoform X2 [Cherax quadricarinatus]|uniref:uncharacterized protein DDB_G0283697-like isoform X2 n=1 Tax=Cherax quadricarinatus TaxID=27406 RepID=UPI00387EBB57
MRLWWVLLTGLLTGVAGQSLQQQTVQDDGSRIESIDTMHEDASHKVFEGIEVTEEAKEENNNTEMPWWQASDSTNKEEMNMTVVEAALAQPHNNTDPVDEALQERPLTKKELRATQKYNNAADVVLKTLAKAMKKVEPFPVSLQEATLQNLRELDEAPSSQTNPQPEEETQKEKRRRKKNKKRRGNNKGGKSDLAESENNQKNKNQEGEEVEEPVRRRKKNKKNKNKNKNRNKNKDKDTTDEDEAVEEGGGDTSALSVEGGKREKQHGKGKNKNKRNKNKRKKNRKNKKKNKGVAASTRDAKALGDYEQEDPEAYTEEVEDVEGRRKGGRPANKKNGKGKKGKRGKKNKKKNKKNRKNKKNKGKHSGSKSRSESLDLEENTGPVLPTQDEMETSNARLTGFSNLARSQDVSVDLSGNQPQFEATFTVGPLKVEMADKARDLTKTQVAIILSARALFKAKNVRSRDKLKLLSMEMMDMTHDTVSVSRSDLIFESEMVSTVQDQVVQAVDVPRIGRILAHELETIFNEEDILQNLEEKFKN